MTGEHQQKPAERRQGLIIKSQGGFFAVCTPQGEMACRGRGLFRKSGTVLVVGDRVEVEPPPPGEEGEGTIVTLLPRKNALARPPVANIDRLALVVSTTEPVPSTLIIDKMTVIAARHNIDAVLIFTKIDLENAAQYEEIYRRAGFAVYTVDSLTGRGTRELRRLVSEGITAFCGNSGAGKSSLLNAILPELDLATGEISKKLGRGRHTTRHVELFPVGTGYIADTPGFSAVEVLRFGRLPVGELAACFIEFRPFLDKCRFKGCSHRVEKGCGVLEAVASGEIPESRHRSYLAIYDELKDIKEWECRADNR